jgi:hypothetical protein
VQHDKSQPKKRNRNVKKSAKISSRVCVTHIKYLMLEASTQLPIFVVYEVTHRQDHLEIKVGWFYGA